MLNLIAGLEHPDAGQVLVDGMVVTHLRRPAPFRREVVGFAFQLHHLLLELTAEENGAMVGGPRLLLADEPTGSLDSASGAQVRCAHRRNTPATPRPAAPGSSAVCKRWKASRPNSQAPAHD